MKLKIRLKKGIFETNYFIVTNCWSIFNTHLEEINKLLYDCINRWNLCIATR